MTVIKQVAVTSERHAKRLEGYLSIDNERHKTAGKGAQNLVDPDRWAREMERTRKAYGHDRAARANCKNTTLYHQVIAFNPDECDMNGGRMGARECLEFARQWAKNQYPNQEVVWVLHEETCARDKKRRWAVHLAINRTNLDTGKRLDEGPAKKAAAARAKAMRKLDEAWGLATLERGRANSKSHRRQPSRKETKAREAMGPGELPEVEKVRRAVALAVAEARGSSEPLSAFERACAARGVEVGRSACGDLQYAWVDAEGARHRANGERLGAAQLADGRAVGLGIGDVRRALGLGRARNVKTAEGARILNME